ncbi:Mobile element protein [Pseudomonas chlororaphis]|uniref:Mobile element protein n=1 Tax=Pseudomonas chlororaphis TaxID=587753 RepID=A0A3G7TQJ6_9PSED|nr:Mobile element protein [Pseudomonas chlororaphis]
MKPAQARPGRAGLPASERQKTGLSLERIPDELAVGILALINGYLGDRGLSLRQGTIVDATLIHAPSSTRNQDGKRDPQMHQTKKGNPYYLGAKAHIGADKDSGLYAKPSFIPNAFEFENVNSETEFASLFRPARVSNLQAH